MTPAQKAIAKKAEYFTQRVNQPYTDQDREALVGILKQIDGDATIWAVGIQEAFKKGGDAIDKLIDGLAAQAIDDFLTMNCVVGTQATIYLLRYFNTKNPA